jgi:hypothetical protein
MKRSLLLIASTAGLLLLASTPAWADPTPTPEVQWTYNFTPTQPFVSADSPGTGTVTFTNEPTKGATNSSDVVITNLRVSSTAPNSSPDKLNSNGAWSATLTLTDTASGASTTMLFSGKLGGTFSATNANVTNTNTGTTTYTWTAPNGNVYTVTLGNFTPPGPPDASNAGSIAAHVSVTPGDGHVSGHAPEPSTLVLSCVGLGFAGFTSWRKRRARATNLA